MKKFLLFFILLNSGIFGSQISNIVFDDTEDSLFSEKLASAFNEATNSFLRQANKEFVFYHTTNGIVTSYHPITVNNMKNLESKSKEKAS